MFNELCDNHIIKTMYNEHKHILCMLNKLEKYKRYLSSSNYNDGLEYMNYINELSIKIIGAEPHHQREEEVLFIKMEEKGILGPPQCMRIEHNIIRRMKHDLKNKSENSNLNWEVRIQEVSEIISNLCETLRTHIEKENNILYPLALQKITKKSEWEKMKIKCDEIGYCCFCPSKNI